MVIGEAMGRGILVIGSSEGGTKELLRSSEVGYTFDSTLEGAENELARLLGRVLRDIQSQNSNEIISKKEKALQCIYQNHSPEVVEREIVTLYRSI